MTRYRCCNCEYVVGTHIPNECPVCHTTRFDDVEPLDNPNHSVNRKRRASDVIINGFAIIAMSIAIGAALLLNGQKAGGLLLVLGGGILGPLSMLTGYWLLRRMPRSPVHSFASSHLGAREQFLNDSCDVEQKVAEVAREEGAITTYLSDSILG